MLWVAGLLLSVSPGSSTNSGTTTTATATTAITITAAARLLLEPRPPAHFAISASAKEVGLGRVVNISVDACGFAPSPNGTVFWPFVNGSQWGSFVTCAVAGRPSTLDGGCSILLPLPYVGTAAISVAVLVTAREWGGYINASNPALPCDEARGCIYPVGTPFPTGALAVRDVVSRSSDVNVAVQYRRISLPLGTDSGEQHDVCMDWEPWHTRHNAGKWIGRPGTSAMPMLGMYGSLHPGVIRQHAIWMTEAGITCIEIDWSNSLWSHRKWAARSVGVQELSNATALALRTYSVMRTEGHDAPKALFMVGLKNGPPATPSEVGNEALWIRDNLLTPLGQRTFVVLDGKPLLLVLYCGQKQAPNASVTAAVSGDGTFTVRWLGTQLQENPDEGLKEGFWSWMDGALAPIPTLRSDGTAEALTVTPAFFAGGGWLGPGAREQNRGSTYVAEMKVAVEHKPTVLLVCQWNEWAGQADHVGIYEDAYNISLTNDMEPTALAECGGYQHKDDAGQLPVCDTGWGFFNLNLLAATLQIYRESILSVHAENTILRLLEPTKPRKWLATAEPDVLSETILRVEWTCIGRGCASGFRVELDDGSKLSKVVPNDNSSTAPPSQSVSLDLTSIGDGVHTVTVTSLSGKTAFPLSRKQRDVDHPHHGSGVGSAARDSVTFRLTKPPLVDRQVVSSAVGFVNQPNQTSYEYGPTIIQENGTYYNFFCSPGGFAPANNSGVVAWDVIRIATSKDGLNWSAPEIVLESSTNYDHSSVCDPSIIKFKGSYFLYHTCINTCIDEKNAPDKYHQNRICVAIADNVRGPFRKVVRPVIQDLSCAPKANATSCGKEVGAYCVGQPSAAVIDGNIVVFYSSIGGANDVMTAPNPGRILAMTSDNGVVFAARSGPPEISEAQAAAPLPPPKAATLFTQRDIDVRYERESQQLVLVQGDVGSPEITWSLSGDGGHSWLPWSRNHTIAVHNASGPGQANHNPGLAGLPDGSFGGRSFSLYGSSFEDPGQWGRWHLFRSDIGVGPTATGCAACAPNGCDHACSAGGKTQRGLCKFPASTDPGKCCECDEYVDPKPCAKCAASAGGCVELCIKAGHLAGMCAFGDDSPNGLCCTCFDLPKHGSHQTAARLKNDDDSIDGGSITMAWKLGHSGACASADIDTMKRDYSVSSVIISNEPHASAWDNPSQGSSPVFLRTANRIAQLKTDGEKSITTVVLPPGALQLPAGSSLEKNSSAPPADGGASTRACRVDHGGGRQLRCTYIKTDDEGGIVSSSQPSTDPRCTNFTTQADFGRTGSVNLLRYGAHGDSVTDDAANLRSAIGCHNRIFVPSPPWEGLIAGGKPVSPSHSPPPSHTVAPACN